MVARGRVQNGVVVLEDGLKLPEGQEVTVLAPAKAPTTPLGQLRPPYSLLDIAPVSLGSIKQPLTAGADLLGEMLDDQ